MAFSRITSQAFVLNAAEVNKRLDSLILKKTNSSWLWRPCPHYVKCLPDCCTKSLGLQDANFGSSGIVTYCRLNYSETRIKGFKGADSPRSCLSKLFVIIISYVKYKEGIENNYFSNFSFKFWLLLVRKKELIVLQPIY